MNGFGSLGNPFAVQSPEDMSARDADHLFVDVFTDFPRIPTEGHCFLHGPRGSGKSMMFRYLLPDCQCLRRKCSVTDLSFFSVWIKLKNTDLKLTELRRLQDEAADVLLNEHFLTMHATERLFASLKDLVLEADRDRRTVDLTVKFGNDVFARLLRECGWTSDFSLASQNSISTCFQAMQTACEGLFKEVLSYLKKTSFRSDIVPYESALCGYFDFLYPLLCELKKLPFMPKGPIFLLFDDADNLNLTQTRVLNTWVSSRTSGQVSIKVSTQLTYKSYRTVTGGTIGTPHDFSEVNISTVYTTSSKNKYPERIRDIVSRRLHLCDYDDSVTPEVFFPCDVEQEQEIDRIAESYKTKWETEGRGYRPSDDAYRYARPDFMRGLGGTSKSSPSYHYAGFSQLVHISSGIIRYFLDAAAQMFATAQSQQGGVPQAIPPGIQDQVVRQSADDFLFTEFARIRDDAKAPRQEKESLTRLFNLIRALGGTFKQILLSDRSERRVFSIAFSDEPTELIRQVLKIGVNYGYFHESSIGNKSGTGRTRLYILSRRLAPHFYLDPTSFAGYLFVTSDQILEAMEAPDRLLRRIKDKGVENVFEERQMALFS